MRENIIIELSDGMKYTVIDMLNIHNNKYFLLAQTSKDETKISDKFDICKYDNVHNNFDYIENVDEYTQVKTLFDQRIEKHRIELSIINKIDFDNLIKLEVLSVKKYDYKIKYNNKSIQKNMEFYSKTKPTKGDYIYMSLSTLNDYMLSYGHIHSLENINHTNILVIEKGDQKIYLQRYYG